MATLADIAEIQNAAVTSLTQRMAAFEAHLKASSPGADLSALYSDFRAFKEHVWSVLSELQQQLMEVSKCIGDAAQEKVCSAWRCDRAAG